MRRAWLAGAAALAVALGVAWWWPGGGPGPDPTAARPSGVAARGPGDPRASSPPVVLHLDLVAEGGVRPDPSSLRIGIARVSDADAAAHRESIARGAPGRLAASRADMATVRRWIDVPSRTLADGTLRLGPLRLPAADRIEVQARAADGLNLYLASFPSADVPPRVRPTPGSGVRIALADAADDVAIQLRRIASPPDAALWQRWLARTSPAVLDAYADVPLPVRAAQVVAPLPPGPVELVLRVRGLEAQRVRLDLPPGRVLDVGFDAGRVAAARRNAVDVALEFVRAGDAAPIEGLRVMHLTGAVEREETTDAQGLALFDGIDRRETQVFAVRAPSTEQGRPQWPARTQVELAPDAFDAASAGILRHRVVLEPLRWLEVDLPAEATARDRERGRPYPVYALQRQDNGRWTDVAGDHFIGTRGGVAASVAEPGTYRVVAAVAPWRLLYSGAATLRAGEGRARARVAPLSGRDVTVVVRRAGVVAANAPVAVVAPVRGLPPAVLRTDAEGRLRLRGVTTPQLRLELPGSDQLVLAVVLPQLTADFAAGER